MYSKIENNLNSLQFYPKEVTILRDCLKNIKNNCFTLFSKNSKQNN